MDKIKEEKDYICAYKYCLHHGERVKDSEAVILNKRHYHWDCAGMKQEILKCVDLYMTICEDKTKFPMVCKIINTLVFKYRVPIDFVESKLENCLSYYDGRPVQALYGLRRLFWEFEFNKK